MKIYFIFLKNSQSIVINLICLLPYQLFSLLTSVLYNVTELRYVLYINNAKILIWLLSIYLLTSIIISQSIGVYKLVDKRAFFKKNIHFYWLTHGLDLAWEIIDNVTTEFKRQYNEVFLGLILWVYVGIKFLIRSMAFVIEYHCKWWVCIKNI